MYLFAILMVAIGVTISLSLSVALLRMHEVRQQERFIEIYKVLESLADRFGQADSGERSSEGGNFCGTR